MLMAAGLGTRLKPFTDLKPKALFPVMGVPIAQFALDAICRAGVKGIVANVHHHAEQARDELQTLDHPGATLNFSDESSELLGSAGGIRKALPLLGDGPFILYNADILCDVDLSALAHAHQRLRQKHGVWLTLCVFPASPGQGAYREIQIDENRGLITGLGEVTRGQPFFVGISIVEKEALTLLPARGASEFVPLILEPAIEKKKAGAFLASGVWHDIGSPRLWLETHLSLMDSLETGIAISPEWRRRIEKTNRRTNERIWVSKDSSARFHASDWVGPAYWNAMEDETALCPERMGPRSVLYGSVCKRIIESDCIGFRGQVVRAI